MRALALLLLVTAYARAQDVDNECDIPLTCSDSERDDDADFDSTVEFPMEEYRKYIAQNETMQFIVQAYSPAQAIDQTIIAPNWYNTCPSYYYTINQWSFYDQEYGRCYVITPITAVRCASKYCRYYVYNDAFQKYYRCFPYYRKVYFWAYCPFDPSSSGFPFRIMSRYVPGGCNCRRYICPARRVGPA